MARSMLWLLASRGSNLAGTMQQELGAVAPGFNTRISCHVSSLQKMSQKGLNEVQLPCSSAFVPANLRPEPQRPGLRKGTPGAVGAT